MSGDPECEDFSAHLDRHRAASGGQVGAPDVISRNPPWRVGATPLTWLGHRPSLRSGLEGSPGVGSVWVVSRTLSLSTHHRIQPCHHAARPKRPHLTAVSSKGRAGVQTGITSASPSAAPAGEGAHPRVGVTGDPSGPARGPRRYPVEMTLSWPTADSPPSARGQWMESPPIPRTAAVDRG